MLEAAGEIARAKPPAAEPAVGPEAAGRARHPATLRFADRALEARFAAAAAAAFAPQLRLGLSVAVGLWTVGGFLLPRFSTVDPALATAVAASMAGANAAAFALSRRRTTLDAQHAIGLAINVLAGLAVLALTVAAGEVERYAAPALMLVSVFAFVVLRLRFVAALAASAVYLAAFAAVAAAHPTPGALVIDAFLLVSAIGSAAAATHLIESTERDLFLERETVALQEAALRAEKAKSDRLLRSILPEAIVAELREDEHAVAHAHPEATVLFADLVGFTRLVERMAPEATAAMLDELYSAFDEISRRRGIEKIKTIGDSYMAAAGVPEPCADHAVRAVAAALDMLEVVRGRAGEALALRIGVHSGPVVAGVIGRTKFSYDLWGDTVNVASRLESQGVAGAVQVSEATRERLAGRFETTPRGEIALRNRSAVRAYLVVDPCGPAAAPEA